MISDYRIDAEIFRLYPGYRRGLALGRQLRNGPSSATLIEQLRTQEAVLRDRIQGNPAEFPRIAAWREAYRRFGARPSDFRSSIEALARRVLRGDALPSINALVDIGNLVSLRYLVPVGVHPVPAGEGVLCLRLSEPTDSFQPPDGAAAEAPEKGEVVFVLENTVLTRRWTWRQSALTLTLPETTTVFFNIDALQGVPDEEIDAAVADIGRLVREYCGGEIDATVLRDIAPSWRPPSH
jgi:DNA/RNA-binding domain of Phe-tRNA-synthetase-like protein